MTSATEMYTAAADQGKSAVESTVGAWRQGTHQLAEQAGQFTGQLPKMDFNEPVQRYFEFVQKTVDVQRELAFRWADLVGQLTSAMVEQAESARSMMVEQADRAADLATEQAGQLREIAHEQADVVEEQKAEAEKAARKAARDEEKANQAKAREQYEGLTKAELSEHLAERGLPKSGNVDELIERLVEDDNSK